MELQRTDLQTLVGWPRRLLRLDFSVLDAAERAKRRKATSIPV